MSLPLTDDLGVVYVTTSGTPVYWNAGLGYDVTGALCITTTVERIGHLHRRQAARCRGASGGG